MICRALSSINVMLRSMKESSPSNWRTTFTTKGVSPVGVFTGYIATFVFLIIAGFISQLDFSSSVRSLFNIFPIISIFDLFFVELFVILLLGMVFINRNIFMRVIVYGVTSLFIVINGVQLASFYQGHEFLSRLAIENVNHISILINAPTILSLLFLAVLCLLLVVFVEKRHRRVTGVGKFSILLFLFLLAGCILLPKSEYWLPDTILKQRDAYLKQNYLQRTSPVLSLYRAIFTGTGSIDSDFSTYELSELQKMGFSIDPRSSYPFVKEQIYNGESPFDLISGKSNRPNIIVFFTEGYSARSISTYGGQYPGLTPNIDAFAKSAMVVNNYYNHTAATYRGLLGQLCSIYPAIGGAGGWQSNYQKMSDSNYLSLAHIFNNNSYKTVFLDAHDKNNAHVDDLMIKIGFKQVLTGVPLARKYLEGAHLNTKAALSDKQFLKSLNGYLKERLENTADDRPFFMSLYNLGTHAFSKISPDGKRYKNKQNQSLDTIHNFDHAFGIFWDYFKKSPYAKNTIVIFTSDHCHYPEKPFVAAFKKTGYQKMFVDAIPLIIYDPTRKLPKSYDAEYATSIDFAPSLLQYLQFPNHENPFLGNSIFAKEKSKLIQNGVASFGDGVYLIDEKKIHKIGFSNTYRVQLKLLQKFIKYSQKIELTGKLWNAEMNATLTNHTLQ